MVWEVDSHGLLYLLEEVLSHWSSHVPETNEADLCIRGMTIGS